MNRRNELIEEGFGLLGMIHEVQAKAKLLKQRDRALNPEYVESQVRQMHIDLSTYSSRLDEIYEEISEYDTISNISGMDGEQN